MHIQNVSSASLNEMFGCVVVSDHCGVDALLPAVGVGVDGRGGRQHVLLPRHRLHDADTPPRPQVHVCRMGYVHFSSLVHVCRMGYVHFSSLVHVCVGWGTFTSVH